MIASRANTLSNVQRKRCRDIISPVRTNPSLASLIGPVGVSMGRLEGLPGIFFLAPVDYRSSPWSDVRRRSAARLGDDPRNAFGQRRLNRAARKTT
jgi:hypothetical protein